MPAGDRTLLRAAAYEAIFSDAEIDTTGETDFVDQLADRPDYEAIFTDADVDVRVEDDCLRSNAHVSIWSTNIEVSPMDDEAITLTEP